LPSRSEFARVSLPPHAAPRCETHRRRSSPPNVAILRSSSLLGDAVALSPAPPSTPSRRRPRRSMGPPSTASCALPEPPDMPARRHRPSGSKGSLIPQLRVRRALARRAPRGLTRSLPIHVGACAAHPPRGGKAGRTFVATELTGYGHGWLNGSRRCARGTRIPRDPPGSS
jgi:hypothetical protein